MGLTFGRSRSSCPAIKPAFGARGGPTDHPHRCGWRTGHDDGHACERPECEVEWPLTVDEVGRRGR